MRLLTALTMISMLLLAACGGSPTPGDQHLEGTAEIMGGKPLADQEAWARALVLIEASDGSRCTGALIDHDLVLTASHCVDLLDENDRRVTLKVLVRKARGGFDTFRTTSTRTHEDYALTRTGAYNDIALIKLEHPADYTIPLMKVATTLEERSRRSSKFLAVGYGKTKDAFVAEDEERVLRSVSVKITTRMQGRQTTFNDQTDMILVDQRSQRGICSGDSGGPLLRREGSGFEIVGVANLVTNPGNQQEPCSGYSAYQSVVYQQNWLNRARFQIREEARGQTNNN